MAAKKMGQAKTRTGKAPMPKKGAVKKMAANPPAKAIKNKPNATATVKGAGPTAGYSGAMVRGSAGEGSY